MGFVEVTLHPRGKISRFYKLATTVPLFMKMPKDTLVDGISVKGWGNLLPRMKFPCNLLFL